MKERTTVTILSYWTGGSPFKVGEVVRRNWVIHPPAAGCGHVTSSTRSGLMIIRYLNEKSRN